MGTFTYRKKPVEIEAFQLTEHDSNLTLSYPQWFMRAIQDGHIVADSEEGVNIRTLEGIMYAHNGDYIIRGVKGELYPCKEDIFKLTYDKVN